MPAALLLRQLSAAGRVIASIWKRLFSVRCACNLPFAYGVGPFGKFAGLRRYIGRFLRSGVIKPDFFGIGSVAVGISLQTCVVVAWIACVPRCNAEKLRPCAIAVAEIFQWHRQNVEIGIDECRITLGMRLHRPNHQQGL